MKSRVIIFALAGVLIAAAVGLGYYFTQPRPTYISGDAWDYALHLEDLPDDWLLSERAITTPFDVGQRAPELGVEPGASLSLTDLRNFYQAQYDPPVFSEFVNLAVEILMYDTVDAAMRAASGEDPGEDWRRADGAQIGDETRVWSYLAPPEAGQINQNLFRVDARYLNAVVSVTMHGTRGALPDPDEPARYAALIVERMRRGARSAELDRLEAAQLTDLRTSLVTQAQLAELEDQLGERWLVDARLLPRWTPTSDLVSEEARRMLTRLGRITGYQMFMIKDLTVAERQTIVTEGFFQQISAYGRADSADQALDLMIGLENAAESPIPPQVGDRARSWTTLLQQTREDGEIVTIAASEVDFRLGRYVGSVRVQTRPLGASERNQAQVDNLQKALILALRLAANLRSAGQ